MRANLILAIAGLLQLGVATAFALSEPGRAATICTVVADAKTGGVLVRDGDCDRRVTPASTFKIAISLMGFDAGILRDEHTPALPFKPGDPDWLPAWRTTTDPTTWIKNSVVWYSQRVTRALGPQRFKAYVEALDFGNQDVSGDPGQSNGLTRAWLGSSLRISPLEQVSFLSRLVERTLPVSAHAFAMTERITEVGAVPGGWDVHGKTGTGFPKLPDGSPDETHGLGWFVGWARRGDDAKVFARLVQDDRPESGTPGIRARDALLAELPLLLTRPGSTP